TSKTTSKTTSKQILIIAQMKKSPKITAGELAKRLGGSEDGIRYHIKSLKKQEMIKRVGSVKSGYWQLMPKYYED
ncbi:MAG: HTH domain-containing protein, partial [Lentisphaeraceae bacterium]|nr:HTH domain-containing protein [Lentisphaeraceae bacterium]